MPRSENSDFGPKNSHFHHCPDCGKDTAGFRDISRCKDPYERPCGSCLAKLYPDVKVYRSVNIKWVEVSGHDTSK